MNSETLPTPDADTLPLTESLAIIRSERFVATDWVNDSPLLCETEVMLKLDKLNKYAPALKSAQRDYYNACEICKDADGLIVNNPLLETFGRKQKCRQDKYFSAYDDACDYVEARVLTIVADALALVGITEAQEVKEIARCAMRGGSLWDGHGFTKPGETPKQPGRAGRLEEDNRPT